MPTVLLVACTGSAPTMHRSGRLYLIIGVLAYGTAMLAVYVLRYAPGAPLARDNRSNKHKLLASTHGEFTSAAFGSSHAVNGFAPVTFDHALEPEFQTHSINLALWAGTLAEQRAFAMEFSAQLQPPPAGQPCLLVLELNTSGSTSANQAKRHAQPLPVDQPVQPSRIGAILQYLRPSVFQRELSLARRSLTADQRTGEQRGQQIEPAEPPADFQRTVATLRRAAAGKAPGSELPPLVAADTQTALDLQNSFPGKVLAFVYVIYPKLDDLAGVRDYPDHLTVAGREVPLIDLARPDKYPFLYTPPYWVNDIHLSGEGAYATTRLLASELKAWYAAHGPPPSCRVR